MTINSIVSAPVAGPLPDTAPSREPARNYRFIQRLLVLYAFLLPYEVALEVIGVTPPIGLRPYRLVGVLIVFVWIMRMAMSRRRRRLDIFDQGFLFVIVLGILAALTWKLLDGQGELRSALSDVSLIGFSFLIYLVIKQEMGEPEQAWALLSAYVVGTVSSILLSAPLLWSFSAGYRFNGFYDNPNSLAFAAAIGLLVLIGRLLFGTSVRLDKHS